MAPNNPLQPWGNDKTMNLNTLILTNIQSSPYFKVKLFELKTFHEVVDEIYYRVEHLEPWEKGSRKTAGQTGMCGGVRGVGAGGIVSSAYCLLFKLFTLKLTKKQVNNLITHSDSPYIRGLGFMYIRYTQPPPELWDWYEPYLDDEEDLDVKAGGGHMMTIGEMLRQWLVKLEWYSTLFPRIPVPIQKDIDVKLRSRPVAYGYQGFGDQVEVEEEPEHIPDDRLSFGEAEKAALAQRGSGSRGGGHQGSTREDFTNGRSVRKLSPPRRQSPQYRRSSPQYSSSRHNYSSRGDDYSRELQREKDRQHREKVKDHKHKSHSKDRRSRSRSRSREKYRSHSRERKERKKEKEHRKEKKSHKHSKDRHRDKERSRDRAYSRERDRSKDRGYSREKERDRSQERSRDWDRRH